MSAGRKPWLAALLSLLTPGLGHIYCGKVLKAVLLFIGELICISIAVEILAQADLGVLNVAIFLLLVIGYYIVVAIAAWKTAKSITPEYSPRWYNQWFVYIILLVISAFSFDAFESFKRFTGLYAIPGFGIYTTYKMPASSMENSLQVGDFLVADMMAYHNNDPQINDVVIFLVPIDNRTPYIKRCIAGPGDVVEMRDKVLFVNGERVPDLPDVKYVDNEIHPVGTDGRDNYGPIEIKPDSYFVMGDNRDNSYDSRFWGPVPRENILGKALRIHWSSDFDRIGMAIQ